MWETGKMFTTTKYAQNQEKGNLKTTRKMCGVFTSPCPTHLPGWVESLKENNLHSHCETLVLG